MRIVQVVLGVVFGVAVFLLLDYALPSRNTVRITNVYTQITDLGANALFFASPDTGTVQTADGRRDIRYIATVRPNGKPYVYRNEDTGWVWPPYFKYDSSNLHAIASDQVSTSAAPKWVSVTSYGWRIAWLSIYPNAVAIRPVTGPADAPRNIAALVVLGALAVLLFLVWRMWNRFRARTLDPARGRMTRAWDQRSQRAEARRDRIVGDVQGSWRRWRARLHRR